MTIKRASEYDYKISGIDYIHIASMEINSIKKIITADKDFDSLESVKRIDLLEY